MTDIYDKLSEDELEEMRQEHERLMQGWMNDLDQDDQAIEDYCND